MGDDGVETLLADPRFELMPFESIEEQLAYVPDGGRIAITSSPQKTVDETVDLCVDLAGRGYRLTPHVAARGVRDADHLADIARRLTEAGIDDVFVPAGDIDEPVGEFDSSYQLLSTLEGLEYGFEEVGITGYPEGHPFLSEETLFEAMERKRPYATYLVTQLCFEPESVVAWIREVRERGIDLPVHVGLPGVMKYRRLLNISQRVGVGESVRFLRKTTGVLDFVRQLLGSRGKYAPDALVDGLAPYCGDDTYRIEGSHLYTFNQMADLEPWRQAKLAE